MMRVMELEQFAHRPERGVVDLLEIERGVDLGETRCRPELGGLPGEVRGLRTWSESPSTIRNAARCVVCQLLDRETR